MAENRLYHTIAEKIRKLIEGGEFPSGSRLPGERDLAQRFGVSRVTVREAEIALEAQGWISIKTGSGVYAKPRPARPDAALPDVTAFELTAARAIIEAEAAALAASRISDADLEELDRLIEAMSDPQVSDEVANASDRSFHLAIARIAGNPVVEHCVQLIWRIRNEQPRVRKVYAHVCHNDNQARTEEHAAILTALRSREPAAARAAMRDHFQRLFEAMLAATENEALAEVRRRTQQDRAQFQAATSL